MATCHGVGVDILINRRPQPIFDDPETIGKDKHRGINHYFEGISEAKFTIRVTLGYEYDLCGADGVLVTSSFDGGDEWQYYLSKEYLDQKRLFTIKSFPRYDAASRHWRNATFSFGKLHLLESADWEEAPVNLGSLGAILIRVERVIARELDEPVPVAARRAEKEVTHVSERQLKGKTIENIVKTVTTGQANPPKHIHKYIPLPGRKGAQLKFKMLYRSRKALQTLGCIPRTPSPTPDSEDAEARYSDPRQNPGKLPITPSSDQGLENTEAFRTLLARVADLEETVKEARAALLEKNIKDKLQASNSVIDLTANDHRKNAKVKRERECTSTGDNKSRERKRLRKADREVIDLTGD